jgi:hypothetical protein
MKIDNSKITSQDKEILKKSLMIIDEHLEKERQRGETAEKRANILITFIGIGAAVVLALSSNFANPVFSMVYLIVSLFLITIIFLVKSIIYTLRIIKVQQKKRLTPDLINDIQNLDIKAALSYEIKWKIWEYNQRIPVNTQKLFWVARAHRNFIFSIITALVLSLILFLDQHISIQSWWFDGIQISFGIFGLAFVLLIDYIFEKYSFWEFSDS